MITELATIAALGIVVYIIIKQIQKNGGFEGAKDIWNP